jgi:hypothetical protein
MSRLLEVSEWCTFTDLGKKKIDYSGLALGSSHLLILLQLPQK